MTKWTPPIETGLMGVRSPEEDLEAFADSIDEMHRTGVYIVKLSTPDNWGVVEERWAEHYEVDPPEWLAQAFESQVVVYVGAAKDVLSRIHTHLDYPNQSTAIARAYPFHSLWDVRWFDDVEEAFIRESSIAIDLRNEYPGMYCHQR